MNLCVWHLLGTCSHTLVIKYFQGRSKTSSFFQPQRTAKSRAKLLMFSKPMIELKKSNGACVGQTICIWVCEMHHVSCFSRVHSLPQSSGAQTVYERCWLGKATYLDCMWGSESTPPVNLFNPGNLDAQKQKQFSTSDNTVCVVTGHQPGYHKVTPNKSWLDHHWCHEISQRMNQ